jgi:hypothetical protein
MLGGWLWCGLALCAWGQIDPVERHLLQFGYNQSLRGNSPLAGYAFYYLNEPGFWRTNLTLRLAVAPVYLDSELGVAKVFGENTDLGVGLAGGGFADTYSEIRGGGYQRQESFTGHGAEGTLSVYHRFNPQQQIPLNGVLRLGARQSVFQRDSDTAAGFVIPEDRQTLPLRSGLRWGGKEPSLSPDAGMEVSAWYEGQMRNSVPAYGYAGDRSVRRDTHLFWGRLLFAYTLPQTDHHVELSLTGGTSLRPDRFSGYRLGGMLPFCSEFPLSLPGYYYQELSARNFAVLSGLYTVPLDQRARWHLVGNAATAMVDYLPGLEQPGDWHSGVGGGLAYRPVSKSWLAMVSYAHGVDAIRTQGRGAHSVNVFLQIDLDHRAPARPDQGIQPEGSRGLMRFLRNIF